MLSDLYSVMDWRISRGRTWHIRHQADQGGRALFFLLRLPHRTALLAKKIVSLGGKETMRKLLAIFWVLLAEALPVAADTDLSPLLGT